MPPCPSVKLRNPARRACSDIWAGNGFGHWRAIRNSLCFVVEYMGVGGRPHTEWGGLRGDNLCKKPTGGGGNACSAAVGSTFEVPSGGLVTHCCLLGPGAAPLREGPRGDNLYKNPREEAETPGVRQCARVSSNCRATRNPVLLARAGGRPRRGGREEGTSIKNPLGGGEERLGRRVRRPWFHGVRTGFGHRRQTCYLTGCSVVMFSRPGETKGLALTGRSKWSSPQ